MVGTSACQTALVLKLDQYACLHITGPSNGAANVKGMMRNCCEGVLMKLRFVNESQLENIVPDILPASLRLHHRPSAPKSRHVMQSQIVVQTKYSHGFMLRKLDGT